MTEINDLWNSYNILYDERPTLVNNIGTASTVNEIATAITALKTLDEQIATVLAEINKLDPIIYTNSDMIKKETPKKKVGRPSKKK